MNYLEEIYKTIESRCGLQINSAHRLSMKDFIHRRIFECSMTEAEYFLYLQNNQQEFSLLINEAAINETYFFREEQHFDYLNRIYFPQNKDKKLSIWSAACSSGEEPLSIYALAKNYNIDVKIYASDIDTQALHKLNERVYKKNSLRSDGNKYHHLLKKIGNFNNSELTIDPSVLDNIECFYYNLIDSSAPKIMPESLDIIFIRNVFIYFTPENRCKILRKLSQLLKPSGLMFLSINEIITIDNATDLCLKKEHTGSIYYLRKFDSAEKKEETEQKNIVIQKDKDNKPVPAANNINEEIKDLFCAIKHSLSEHDCTKAECLLNSYYFAPHNMEYQYFMEGLIHLEANNDSLAETAFEKAIILNKDFWPSTFQLGLIQKKKGKEQESIKTFSQCSQSLNSYLNNKNLCYNTFTGSFSPEYFLALCKNYINGV